MTDRFSGEFDRALRADMERLAAEVSRHRETGEHKNVNEREFLKQSITRLYPVLKNDGANEASPPQSSGPLPSYANDASPETKLEIEYLLDTALRHGIEKANAAAKNSSPFVIDAFHDALAGKLYPELERRGLLK